MAIEPTNLLRNGILEYFTKSPPVPIESYKVLSATGQELAAQPHNPEKYALSVLGKDAVKLTRTIAKETDQLVVPLDAILAVTYSKKNELTIVMSS
jgi:hypothetical protein